RSYSFALAKLPPEAAATTVALLVWLAVGTIPVSAQMHVPNSTGAMSAPKNALDQQLRLEMGCVCGGCAHEPLTLCTCATAQRMRAALREQIDQDKSHDEIIQAFIGLYGGQQFLAQPLDKGFNRLAWLFPYL